MWGVHMAGKEFADPDGDLSRVDPEAVLFPLGADVHGHCLFALDCFGAGPACAAAAEHVHDPRRQRLYLR